MKKGVLKKFTKFIGKHLCQSLFFNKVAGLRPASLSKKTLWHRCFPLNFVKFLRTPFLQNTSEELLLNLSRRILMLIIVVCLLLFSLLFQSFLKVFTDLFLDRECRGLSKKKKKKKINFRLIIRITIFMSMNKKLFQLQRNLKGKYFVESCLLLLWRESTISMMHDHYVAFSSISLMRDF